MGIWGDFALRHFNISPLVEGGTALTAVMLAALRMEDFTAFSARRNIDRSTAVDIARGAGFPHVVETRDLTNVIANIPDRVAFDRWTGFYSRLDAISVLCFSEEADAEIVRGIQANLEGSRNDPPSSRDTNP